MENNEVNKLDMKSTDIVSNNIEKIEKLFPNVVKEGKIDFNSLKQELTNDLIDENKEKYQLTWVGKKQSVIDANTPTNNALRPSREESVNFETTKNIYIEGDNLDVLKLLQEAYLSKIKCIYIDPPYNTGRDFIYKDNFIKEESIELLNSSQIDEYNNKLISNNDSNGRFHSDWLSMMYSRIKLSRNLLTEDGIMIISIDDNEQVNLKKICDEVFGERNFIACLPTVMNLKGNNDEYGFAGTHEYTLVYSKNTKIPVFNNLRIKDTSKIKQEWNEDDYGYYKVGTLKGGGENGSRLLRPNLYFPIYVSDDCDFSLEKSEKFCHELLPISNGSDMTWRWSKEKILNERHNIIVEKRGEEFVINRKIRPADGENPSIKPKTLFYKESYSSGNGVKVIKELFDGKRIFNYSKPIELLSDLLEIVTNPKSNDIVLDFFSGSASTAHAVMKLNSEDNGNRRYIMVQLPERCEESSEAYKAGFKYITEIGKERIRRAAQKIKEETNANIDYGFRVFKDDTSNMKDVYYEPSKLNQTQLNMFESNIKEDRTAEDLLTQVILDLGLTLDLNIEEKDILNNKVYFVANNALVACFDERINIDIINKICEVKPLKVVFRESSFRNDSDKINTYERIKKLSPETEISVI